ncbi:hypothetical protein [Thermococcus sp. JCM 11816]|uniref:hypothetical protein n=1 Tax=Thermococcus sp. (strain JCM 11816 / KS-1) TaxID=1295125 RepID=UPI000A97A3F6
MKRAGTSRFRSFFLRRYPSRCPPSTLPSSGWEGGKFLAGGGDFVRGGVYLSGESTVELLVSVPSNASVGWYPIEVGAGDARTTLSVYVSKSHAGGENGTVTVKVLDPESGNYIPGGLCSAPS